jgi:UDP-glucose 4-epimerase
MRVLVTGGAGYIGSVISARLLAQDHQVTVFDDLSRGHRAAIPAGALYVRGDVRDEAGLRAALQKHRCDAIIHMAALAEVAESVAEPDLYRDVNLHGTEALVEAAVACGVGRLVFSSTAAVYGEPNTVPIDESAALAPTNPYGETKLAAERVIQAAGARGLAASALRYFNAAGADGACGEDHEPESHLIPLALRAARDERPLRVFGDDYPTPDGTCIRDYVHVVDLAEAHISALEGLPETAGAFNLGTGDGNSVLEVVEAVEVITGRPVPRRVDGRRPGDPPALVASNALAGERLGWRPQRHLLQCVMDAWEWLRAYPDGYLE